MTTDREPTLEEQIEAIYRSADNLIDHRCGFVRKERDRVLHTALNAAAATLRRVQDGSLVREAIEAWKAAQELTTRLP